MRIKNENPILKFCECGNQLSYYAKKCKTCYNRESISGVNNPRYNPARHGLEFETRIIDDKLYHIRNCPNLDCSNFMKYTTLESCIGKHLQNSVCKSCSVKGRTPWNKNLTKYDHPLLFEHSIRMSGSGSILYYLTGSANASVKRILNQNQISYSEYLDSIPERELYYKNVWNLTDKQPLYLLENCNKRGPCSTSGSYQLDHIYSIDSGFRNDIPYELIGSIENLRFIKWELNNQKSNSIEWAALQSHTQLLDYISNKTKK